MNSLLLFSPIGLPFLTAVLCLLARQSIEAQRIMAIVGMMLTLAVSIVLLVVVDREGYLVALMGAWEAPIGISLVADRFSALMVVVSSLTAAACIIYASHDITSERKHLYFYPFFGFLMMGVNGAFLTGDIFNLYVWFEVMLLSSFVLLVIGNDRAQLEGGLKYVIINLLSSALFLIGVGILYAEIGTLNMADIAAKIADHPDAAALDIAGVLFLAAFGVKAGIFPLFFWLPASYHTPPTTIAAVFAGLLTKVGVYALIRTFTLLFPHSGAFFMPIIGFLAVATMVTGVLGAASHFDIKRILSFHIISQIGYMILGLAIMTPMALAGAIFYIFHHIIVKSNLFLIGGLIERRTGTSHLKGTGGLFKAAPWMAILFFIPAFSLGGIPPLSGFWAKLAIVQAALAEQAWWLTGFALFVGLLTLFSMTKIWAEAFWKAPPEPKPDQPKPRPLTFSLVFPCIALAALTLAIGFFGEPLFAYSERAAHQLLNPSEYINAVLPSVEP